MSAPDTRTEAERLREAVVNAARDECLAYTESAGAYLGDPLDWARYVTFTGPLPVLPDHRLAWDAGLGPNDPAAAVLRAVVETLGITHAMVRQVQPTPLICHDTTCVECAPARALATLLTAAGIEP